MDTKFILGALTILAVFVLVAVFIRRVREEDEESPGSTLKEGIRAIGWVSLALAGLFVGTFIYRNMPIAPMRYAGTEEFGRIVISVSSGTVTSLFLLALKYWAKDFAGMYWAYRDSRERLIGW